MQRNVVLPIVGGVLAALVIVGAILVIGKNNNKKTELAISTPLPTETASSSPAPTETTSSSPTASASSTPSATVVAPTTTPVSPGNDVRTPAPTATPYRAISSVNCADASDAKYCSREDTMSIQSDKYASAPKNQGSVTYPNSPTITMVSTIQKSDHSTAHVGDKPSFLHVEVTVQNNTKMTFGFPKREIDLVIMRNGKVFDTLKTSGPGFAMTPPGHMSAKFDDTVYQDGTYTWQAKTWYFTQ